ncbi:MAG: 50S ribosomal protein L25/general stress protein Ctc [Gammaproteobacteria bacterium]|nr:50S ribosomal protein L25/general stress protein Ctc [Gammaproteobacteria bacterium]MXW51910.1 50S ribosomal protein L25/general stress protein Ctc [Gammaproteobacteria bacterium]MYF12634.1 50S ribosomal protein L25/general stress protein Ctc [Gammaproteobacteria bacterium]MYG14252.1 50S ribosomal protein L25/general stress protein Ctc [Gammaproteobacteria bacterium]MYK28687.1 50S ribosomal protein L25/general stress protein Ctc [Gammaproteobacteria bacterium]
MPQSIELNASLRTELGTGASRRLRRSGERLPGVIYGGENAPQPVTLSANELTKAMQQEAFLSQIVNVKVDGTEQQALVRSLQLHPVNEKVLHVDFLRVEADRPIQTNVPLHFVNESKCVGVRTGGGSIAHNLVDVEVSCLPNDLPEFIEVDLAALEVGQALHLSDLNLPEGVTLVALGYGEDHDIPVVSVQPPRGGTAQAEEEEEAAAAEEEAPAEPDATAED